MSDEGNCVRASGDGQNAASGGADPPLVLRLRYGDEGAWREVFDEYFVPLYRLFRSRAGHHETAEDLAIETLMRAHGAIGEHRAHRPFTAWIFEIAREVLIAHARRASAGTWSPFVRAEYVDTFVGPLLNGLPAADRIALELRYVVGLPSEAAAAVMGCSERELESICLRAERLIVS